MRKGLDGGRLIFALRLSLLLLLLLASTSHVNSALAQAADTTRSRTIVEGAIAVTSNGISTIPSFSLGKPAAIFDVYITRNRFSLDPEVKYALDGKPWSFLFWGHYKLADGARFRVILGAHPAVNFMTMTVPVNQTDEEVIVARRFLAADIYPSYALSRYVTVGGYYLYLYGVEHDVVKHTHLLALRSIFSSTPIVGGYFVQLYPQIYYLKADTRDGYYFFSGLAVGKRNFPLSIAATANKVIETRVPGGEDFLWNVSASWLIR
jgi:hypothetical protein